MSSYVEIEKTVSKSKEYPYSNCTNNLNDINSYHSIFYKYIIARNTTTYDQESCNALCYQRFVSGNCNCYDANHSLPPNQSYGLCLNITQLSCNFVNFVSFYGEEGKVNELCSEDCPKECESVTYSKSLSMKSFPTRSFADLFKNYSKIISQFPVGTNITYELIKENFLIVRVYYSKLAYTEITESEKISPFNFLSILGGNASLFLGISLLSFVEILEVIFEIISVIFQSKNNTVGSS
jgi:hypothetical protein